MLLFARPAVCLSTSSRPYVSGLCNLPVCVCTYGVSMARASDLYPHFLRVLAGAEELWKQTRRVRDRNRNTKRPANDLPENRLFIAAKSLHAEIRKKKKIRKQNKRLKD